MKKVLIVVTLILLVLSIVTSGVSANELNLEPPTFNFCSASGIARTQYLDTSTDIDAGVMYVSSIRVPKDSGGSVCIYIKNLGPGSIAYNRPAWNGFKDPKMTSGMIQITPNDNTAFFSDSGWSGEFAQDSIKQGVIYLDSYGTKGTAHMDLTLYRAGEPHTIRINVQFR